MMALETQPYVFANHVENNKDAGEYLAILLEENGIDGLIEGVKHLAKAKGMTAVANEAGVNRQSLYRSLAKEGNPKIETIDKIVRALGFKLTIERL